MVKTNKTAEHLIKFIFPIALGFSVFYLVGILINESLSYKYWSLIGGYFFPPLGKESIIPIGIGLGIHPIVMALSIAFVDIVVALFLLWNYDFAKKIPFVGKFMIKVESKGKDFEKKYKWIKPLRFLGIVLFVIIPFQGSGGLVGSIVGRLVGMKPKNTFYAITIGAISGTLLIASFSHIFIELSKYNTILTVILIAVIVLIIALYFIIKKIKKN